jgi:type II secretory pathway pseudopilin PulG
MSDASQGPGWWLASDGKWYPPEPVAPKPAPPPPISPPPPATGPPMSPPPPAVPPPAAPPPSSPPPPAAGPSPAPSASFPPPVVAAATAPTEPIVPPAPTQPAPSASTPASSSGSGCLKAFLIAFVILAVIGIGIVVTLAFFVNRAANKLTTAANQLGDSAAAEQHYEDQTGITSNPLAFDVAHPPQLDIWKRPIRCSYSSSSSIAVASGTVLNHTSKASAYGIVVSFTRGGTEVGSSFDGVVNVAPGATAAWQASGEVTGSGSVGCKVTEILRTSQALLVPTTTK